MDEDFILNKLCDRYPLLTSVRSNILQAAEMIIDSYAKGGKLLVCGNGGSSSDSEHLVGELMKSFELRRPVGADIAKKLTQVSGERGPFLAQKLESGLPAISLSSQTALTTAISNDIDANLIFAQQIIGYGCEKDVFIGISTSGNSQNIIDACITAKAMNLNVVGISGFTGGVMKDFCDVMINVPEKKTAYVQELHLPILHTLCQLIESHFFGNNE